MDEGEWTVVIGAVEGSLCMVAAQYERMNLEERERVKTYYKNELYFTSYQMNN